MKKYFLAVSGVLSLLVTLKVFGQPEDPADEEAMEMHPPVILDVDRKQTAVFFMRDHPKKDTSDFYGGTIYFLQLKPFMPKLSYVWRVNDEDILSVFFNENNFYGKKSTSMFVLSKRYVSDRLRRGSYYSVMELPVISELGKLYPYFFTGDPQDPKLENCFEGVEIETGQTLKCDYKKASSIKIYLKTRGW